jgi:hypothetical protein
VSLGTATRGAKHRVMLARRDLSQLASATRQVGDPSQRRVRAIVRRNMVLPDLPERRRVRGSVWAVAMVRNEEDIITDVVRHLLAQGVDAVLVVDNMSTDRTRSRLSHLAGRHAV